MGSARKVEDDTLNIVYYFIIYIITENKPSVYSYLGPDTSATLNKLKNKLFEAGACYDYRLVHSRSERRFRCD